MANEDRLKLFKAIGKAGYDIGNYEDFDRRMNSAEDRQKFYTAVNDAGFDIGPQEDFERRISPSKYKLTVNGNEVQISEQEYLDFLKRHPSGTNAKPKPQQTQGQTKPRQAYQPTPEEMAGFQSTIRSASRTAANPIQSYDRKAELMKKRQGLNVPQRINIGESNNLTPTEQHFNPETGEMEQGYMTGSGNEYTNKAVADIEQREIDQYERDRRYEREHPEEALETDLDGKIADLEQKRNEAYASALEKARAATEPQSGIGKAIRDFFTPERGGIGSRDRAMDIARNDENVMALDVALRDLQEAKTMMLRNRELSKSSDFLGGVGLPLTKDWFNNWKNFGYGVWDAINDVTVNFAGSNDIDKAKTYLRIKDKMERGEELTDTETSLALAGMSLARAQQIADLPTAYTAGQTTMEMLPFMVQMASNPASGIGKSFARKAVRQFGRNGLKAVTARVAARLAGNVGEAAVLSNTWQAPKTMGDIAQRYAGEFGYDEDGNIILGHNEKDEEGNDVFVEGGKSLGQSIWEGEAASIIENFTELGAGGSVNKILSRAAGSKLGKKIGLGYVSDLVGKVGSTPFARNMKRFMERTHWDGMIEEPLEEEYGIILNSLLTGDNKISDLWDSKQQADIFAGTMWFGGMMAAMNTAAYPFAKRMMKRKLNNADVEGEMAFRDEWPTMKAAIDDMDDKKIADFLYDIKDDDKFSNEQKAAMFGYAARLKEYQGANVADMLMRMENNLGDNEAAIKNAYDSGTDAQTPDEMKIYVDEAETAGQNLTGYGQEFAAMVANGSADPAKTLDYMMSNRDIYSDEEIAAAADYYQKHARAQGVMDARLDGVDLEVEKANAQVRSTTHQQTGSVIMAKGDGDMDYYIIGGDVVTDPETGLTTLAGTGGAVVVKDPITGEVSVKSPQDVTVYSMQPADELIQQNETVLRQQLMQQADDDITYGNPAKEVFDLEDTVTLQDGEGGVIDGEIVTLPNAVDGVFVIQTKDGKALQMTADDMNRRIVAHNGMEVQRTTPQAVNVPQNAEAGTDANENVPEGQINGQINPSETPAEGVQQPEIQQNGNGEETEQQQSALSRIPVATDEQGRPILNKKGRPQYQWHKASVEDAAAALVETTGGDMLMARNNANRLVKTAQTKLEKIRKQEPKGEDPLELAENSLEIKRAENEVQETIRQWRDVAASIQKQMDAESERLRQEAESSKSAEQKAREAEEARIRKEKQDEIDRERRRKKIEEEIAQWNKPYAPLAKARKEMESDREAMDILDRTEPETLEEWVSSLIQPQSMMWDDETDPTTGRTIVGLQSELGLQKKDIERIGGLVAPRSKGGKPFGQVVHDIWESLPEGMKSMYDDQDVRNALIGLFGEGNTMRMRHLAEEHRIEEARQLQKENARRDAEAEMDAWCDFYHLNPEERATFEDLMSTLEPPYAVEENIINQIIADNEQNRTSARLDSPDVSGGNAGEVEGGEGQVRQAAEAADNGNPEQGTVAEGETAAGEQAPADNNVPGGESIFVTPGGTIGRSLTEDEADDLIIESAARAEAIPEIELTPESWNAEFGNGVLTTPIGDVKISDNQYSKTVEKGRAREFGMIRPTLTNPDFIIEVDSEAKDGQSERPTSYLFVKAFIGKDGKKQYFFKSVTVQRDGMEVNVSNHFDRPKRVRESLEKGKLLYRFDGGAQTEQSPATVSVTTPQTNPGVESEDVIADLSEPDQSDAAADVSKPQTPGENGGETINAETQASSSEGKDTNISANLQEKTEKSLQLGKTSSPEQIAEEENRVDTNPTEGQKEAGNYQKGHINVDGYDITIENPKGSIRSGVDSSGKKWEQEMHNTYGYIRGTEGVDGDHIDVFLSDDPTSGNVYVVDQVKPDGSFDEVKVMYGFKDAAEAAQAYLSNYSKGWKGLGAISGVSREAFKEWIESSHRKTKPFREYALAKREQLKNQEPEIKPSEQLKPTDLRDGIKPDTAELGAEEAKAKAQSQQHLQAVREKVKGLLEKYRSLAPIQVIDINSDDDLLLISDKDEIEQARKYLKDSKLPAAYDTISKKIYIFAENISEDEVEEGFFHENLHRGLQQYYGDGLIEVAEAFWETESPTNPEGTRIRKQAISEAYAKKPEDIKEEYLVHAFAHQMTNGTVENLFPRLSAEHQEILSNILINIGYDRTKESAQRKRTGESGQEGAGEEVSPSIQDSETGRGRVTPSSADRIEDVGEEIAGARKDMSRKIAQSLDSATKQTLAELPFSKAYKKPDLKKAVEEGALRESDATFYDAFFSTFIDPNKPRVTQSEARRKKYTPDYRTGLEKWVERTHQMLQTLKEFVEADEQQRDRMIESLLADKYPFRDAELADIEKRKEWNKDDKDIVWGDKTSPNPLWITYEVMKQMGYSPGDKVDIPYGILKSNSTGTGYSIRNKKDELMGYSFPKSVEEGIDAIVWLARLKRGDTDIQHPVYSFYTVPTKSQTAENGRYRVVYGSWRSPQSREFDSKEEADAFAAKKPGAQTVALREVVRRFGYKPMFRHPLTGERIAVNDREFDTEAEARQYIEENYEELNNDLNTQLSSQQKESSGKKELTADDLLYTAIVRGKDGRYGYAVLIDKKYANNYGMPLILKEGFASRDDAKAYADGVKNQVLKVYNDYKSKQKAFTYFDTGEDSRIGEDYRNGKDVTADDFMNAFGFRGVQFGNWTNQRDRQMAVNQAYDALLDLAKLIGVSPRALSLNGELGIAFGARGSGNASAHYEPGEIVINLTKTKGAGSLAHEWWHALDNYFARTAGEKGGMVTDDRTLPMRKELRDAYNTLVDQLKESNYYTRSKNKGDYWGRMHEVTARLLSEWVDQQLKKRGELNTFLSRGAKTDGTMEMNYERYKAHAELAGKEVMPFEEYKKLDEAMSGSPYPSAHEVERFSAAMQNIFDVMQEREDEETGRVALYHKLDDSQAEAPKAEPGSQDTTLRDAIVELLQDAGIDVITDDAEGQRTLDDPDAMIRQQKVDDENVAQTVDMRPIEERVVRNPNIRETLDIQDEVAKLTPEEVVAAYKRINGQMLEDGLNVDEHEEKVRQEHIARHGVEGLGQVMADHMKYLSDKYGYGMLSLRWDLLDRIEEEGLQDMLDQDEAAPLQAKVYDIQGRPVYFKTKDGQAYGYTYKGKIYLDPSSATAETPVHEYTHLWAEAVRQKDPKTWANIVDVLKNDPAVRPFWDKVAAQYPELTDENDIAEEVLAQYSGRRGSDRLREVAGDIARENGGIFGKAQAVEALRRMRNILARFWKAVADVLGWKYSRADEIADKVLYDLLSGVKPEAEGSSEVREQRVPDDDSWTDDVAQEMYEETLAKEISQRQERWQDAMISLKAIQDAIAAETGNVATAAEDAYRFENRMHGRAKNMSERYDWHFYQPMLKAFNDFINANGMTREQGLEYLISKSGLERNVYYAFRDAAKAKLTEDIEKARKKLEKEYSAKLIDEGDYLLRKKDIEKKEREGVDDTIKQVRETLAYQRAKEDYQDGSIGYTEYLRRIESVIRSHLKEYDTYAKDYSGLTETFAKEWYVDAQETKKQAQRAIDPKERRALWSEYDQQMRQAYEMARQLAEDAVFAAETGAGDHKELWDRINAATKETLRHSYESGLMDRKTRDKVSNMFDYYIPLRGWDDDKASDVYTYMGKENVFSPAVKKTWGRKSQADNPLAYIGNIAVSTILSGHRNQMKQHFLNYVMNNPTSLVSISESWYENIAPEGETPVWILRTADTAGKSADEIVQIVNDFNEEMRQKQQEGKAMPVTGRLRLDVHATSGQKAEHMVEVQRAGHTYQLYINGNPRAAQALNGTLGKAARLRDIPHVGKFVSGMNHSMAAFFTSKNPAFVISNLSRDLNMAGASVAIKEDKEYNAKFIANVAKVLAPRLGEGSDWNKLKKQPTGLMPSLMRKWKKGTLDMSNETERYFKEFMDEGGETGFVNMLSVDSFKEKLEKEISQMNGSDFFGRGVKETTVRKGLRLMGETFEFYNRCAEDATRFIVYMTSRQSGKGLEDSIADAKDVTLNFNRKGTGEGWTGLIQDLFIFVNPAIQALANMYKMATNKPLRFGAVTGAFVAGGVLIPVINQWLMNMFGDDDDKDAYWNLPPWVRKNNLVMWIPFTDNFITIPLAQEFRVFYGVGEMIGSYVYDHPHHNAGLEVVESLADLIPINPTGNGGNLIIDLAPTLTQPLMQIAFNTDFTGKPIWRDNQGNKYQPVASKAYVSTPKAMVRISEFINMVTGGDEDTRGWLERSKAGSYLNNPAIWNHLLQGYFGGMYNTISKAIDTAGSLAQGELPEIYRVPVVNRFLNRPSERETSSTLGEDYWELIEGNDEFQNVLKKKKEKTKDGDEKAKEKLERMMQSEDYHRSLVISSYEKMIDEARKIEKSSEGEKEKEYRQITLDLKEAMMEDLAAIDGGNDPVELAMKKFDESEDPRRRKAMASRISKEAGASKDPYGDKPDSDHAYQYQVQRNGDDVWEDAVLYAYQERLRDEGKEDEKKTLSNERTKVHYPGGTRDPLFKLHGGNSDKVIMDNIRKKRKSLLEKYGLDKNKPPKAEAESSK